MPHQVGFAYGPHRQHERPPFLFTQTGQEPRLLGLQPLPEELEEDANILAAILPGGAPIRVYSSRNGPGEAAAVLAERGFSVTLGLFIGEDDSENSAEIDAAISLLDRFPDRISRVIVGNETQGTGPGSSPLIPLDTFVNLILAVKTRVAGRVPVAAAEVLSVWMPAPGAVNEALTQVVDEIVVHIYGYWGGVGVESAVDHMYDRLDWLRDALVESELDRPIILGETGWPAGGKSIGAAQPGGAQQRRFLGDLLERAQQRPEYPIFIFEAFSEPWKLLLEDNAPEEDRFGVEDKWGILTWRRELRPDLVDLFPIPPAPRAESSWFRVFTRGELAPGHDAGVDSFRERHDWLSTEGDRFALRYPEDDCWGTMFITRGAPTATIPRPLAWDLSDYSHLVTILSGDGDNVEIAIKDANDPDDGTETQVRVLGLLQEPQMLSLPLSVFDMDGVLDRSSIYVDAAFNFIGREPQTVRVDEIYYLPIGQNPPDGALAFEVVARPDVGEPELFVGGCLNRWLTANVATASGQTQGVLQDDPAEPNALRFDTPAGEAFASVFFHVGESENPPRTNYQDFSEFGSLVLEIRGAIGNEPVSVAVKDRFTTGAGMRVPIEGITQDWRTLRIELATLTPLEAAILSVVFELVFTDSTEHTIWFRDVRYE